MILKILSEVLIANRRMADMEAYLPPETLHWCQSEIRRLGYPDLIKRGHTLADGRRMHFACFLDLREAINRHYHSGNVDPVLDMATAPRGGYRWCHPANQIQQEIDDMVDYGDEELENNSVAEGFEDPNVGEESDEDAGLFDFRIEIP
jgi:hypothetical protein